MNVTRYINTREGEEGEEVKRGTLLFLNFKLTHNQLPENYISLFECFVSEDPIVHSMGNKYISINTLFKDEILNKNGYPRFYIVKLQLMTFWIEMRFMTKRKRKL
jgi:hypothetical protein